MYLIYSGITELEEKMFLTGRVEVVNKEGQIGLVSAGRIELSSNVV